MRMENQTEITNVCAVVTLIYRNLVTQLPKSDEQEMGLKFKIDLR